MINFFNTVADLLSTLFEYFWGMVQSIGYMILMGLYSFQGIFSYIQYLPAPLIIAITIILIVSMVYIFLGR